MPDPWITISSDNVLDAMTSKERDDFGRVAAADSRPDRVPGILSALIAEIRGYIVTWSTNTLSADSTLIPGSMLGQAIAIARWRILASIPGYNPGDARKAEYSAAQTYFAQVAAGKIRPQPAPDAVTNPVPLELPEHGAKVVSRVPKITGRRHVRGL